MKVFTLLITCIVAVMAYILLVDLILKRTFSRTFNYKTVITIAVLIASAFSLVVALSSAIYLNL